MTALQAKSCSPHPWVHRVTALFRSRIMQILIPFRSHLRLAGHEMREVFAANKSFKRGGVGGGRAGRYGRRKDDKKENWVAGSCK